VYDGRHAGLAVRGELRRLEIVDGVICRKTLAKSGKNAGKEITMPSTRRLGRYPIMNLKHAREAARAFLTNPNKAEYQNKRGKLLPLVVYNQIPAKFTVNC
jgi:hypothetical protein